MSIMKKQIVVFVLVLLLASMACKTFSATEVAPLPAATEEIVIPVVPTEAPVEPILPPVELPTTEPVPAASGDVLFADDFSDTNSGWPTDRSGNGVADYENGGYRILVDKVNTYYWGHPEQYFSGDIRVEADAKVLGGPEMNEFGIICRHVDDKNYYYFTIISLGHVLIGGLMSTLFCRVMQLTTWRQIV
jgi:hypothetical protein